MIEKNINKEQFKEAIKMSFVNDPDIFVMYAPGIRVNNVSDIVEDISKRICSDVSTATIKGVYEKNILIGYYVYDYNRKTLVSFGLNVGYRSRKYLKQFWSLIRSDLKGMFQCILWTRNIRGIKWLQKNGMNIVASDNLITQLILTCQ